MSNSVFPTFPGLAWSRFRTPEFATIRKTTDSGREFVRSQYSSPRYAYKLNFEVLRAGALAELETLQGFFCQMRGDYDTWLFNDPDDNTATAQQFAVGNGSATQFQLVRSLGGFIDPIYELNGAPVVKVGSTVTSVTYDAHTGLVTFATAPAAGATLTWSGQYYWRCRFTKSVMELEQFMSKLWSAKSVEFKTVKP